MQNPLWQYAAGTYGVEGVAASCLALQDGFGMDVNLLLYAAWLAQSDHLLSVAHLAALDASVSDWRDRVVRPLRALRRHLRSMAGASELCDGIMTLELRAEREQLDRMYAFYRQSGALPRSRQPLHENLKIVAHFASPADGSWGPAVGNLASLIPR